ncbi:MAG: outer membrane protein transport protein [Myxococcota bacterium]
MISVRTLAAALALVLGSLVVASTADAGGFHISILGARRTGMMTNVANPDDITALFHNPAGLADQRGTRLHLSSGMTFLQTDAHLKALDPQRFPEINRADCEEASTPPCAWPIDDEGYYEDGIGPERYFGVIPYLGVSQDLGFMAPGLEDLVVSAAVYAPGAYGAFLPENAPTAYYAIEGLFVVIAGTAGLGWKLSDKLSIGAAGSVNYLSLGFSQKFSTIDLLTPEGEEPDLPAKIAQAMIGDLKIDYQGKDWGYGWGVGVLYRPFRWLAAGAGYSGWTSASFRGPLEVSALGSEITGTPPMTPEELKPLVNGLGFKLPKRLRVDMPIPPVLQAGIAVKPLPWLELAVDGRLWLYTLFERQIMRPRYDPDESGEEPLTEETLSKDKNYSNSYEIAVGALVRPFTSLRQLELMIGLAFDKSPVPNETFSIDNPSMDQAIISVGARLLLAETWKVGVAYMLITYMGRDVKNSQTSPPTNVRLRGRAHIPTLEVEYQF